MSAATPIPPSPPVAGKPDKEKFDAELWAELYTLREAVKGPEGYTSWQDAAVDERMKRHAAEGKLSAHEAEVGRLRDQIKNLERIKNDLQTRLFKALETEPTLTAALREVDHTPGGSLSRSLYSDVLDIACVHIAKVKELEAALTQGDKS